MKLKFKILIIIILMTFTLGIMSNTYSRYVADTTGDLNVQFAPWKILINENDIINNKETSLALEPVIQSNENVAPNMIAPSSKGYFDIAIDPTNTGTSFNYQISLDVLNSQIPDFLINKYAILDSDYIEGEEITETIINDKVINGEVNITPEGIKPFTIRVFFEWYEGENEQMDDDADTQVGTNETENISVQANIKFTQKI